MSVAKRHVSSLVQPVRTTPRHKVPSSHPCHLCSKLQGMKKRRVTPESRLSLPFHVSACKGKGEKGDCTRVGRVVGEKTPELLDGREELHAQSSLTGEGVYCDVRMPSLVGGGTGGYRGCWVGGGGGGGTGGHQGCWGGGGGGDWGIPGLLDGETGGHQGCWVGD